MAVGPRGIEAGLISIRWLDAAGDDTLVGGLPDPLSGWCATRRCHRGVAAIGVLAGAVRSVRSPGVSGGLPLVRRATPSGGKRCHHAHVAGLHGAGRKWRQR